MEPEPGSAAYFDNWYADMAVVPVQAEIQQRHLGLPPRLLSTSLLPWDGIAEVVAALRPSGGAILVDLACGRGGYGLEIAGRTGARLVGIDFSAEAVRQARDNARRRSSASVTWPRPGCTPGRPAACCAWTRSSSPPSPRPPTPRCGGSWH